MPDKQGFGFLLARLREGKGMSQQAIGDLIGVSRSAVNGYEKGKSYPVADKLLKLAQHFHVSVDYLLTGQDGQMQFFEAKASESQKPLNNLTLHSPDPATPVAEPEPRFYSQETGENTEAPLYNLPTAASYLGQGLSQERAEPDGVLSLPTWLLKRGNHAVFPVIGDSMEPTFFAKDYVICRELKSSEWFDLRPDNVAVIVSDSRGLQLKRLAFRPAEKMVRCKSDNRQHPSYNLFLSEVREVWRFEWRITASAANLTESFEDRMRHLEEGQEDMRYLLEQLMDSRELRRLESRRNTNNAE
jgi:transcriptional regulator with XRE-family HTH domain